MIAGATLFILASLFQVHPKDKNLWYDKDLGISVRKPPKKEEWKFESDKTKLRLGDSKFAVKHVVSEVTIEFALFLKPAPPSEQKNFNADSAEYNLKSYLDSITVGPYYKKVKKKPIVKGYLPRKADGGARAWSVEMNVTLQNDVELEWKMWTYVTKASRSLCYVNVLGPPGSYKKHRKEIEAILSTLRTYKVKK